MKDFIIIAVLIAAVVLATLSAIKHFKGEGGCCGGGSYKPRHKRLSGIKYKRTFKIEGMHCKRCAQRVEEAVNGLDGVAGRVRLKKGELTVSYKEELSDEIIRKRIEEAGYTVK